MTHNRYRGLRALGTTTGQSTLRRNEIASTIYPALVGRVFANPKVPTSTGSYFSVHPVSVSGFEAESNAGILTADSSRSLLVYVVGSKAPLAGEDLVCRFVGNRWVAERSGKTSDKITVPGCPCLVPLSLHMSVIHPEANFGMFQDATLSYITVPPELAPLALGTKAYISTTTFHDAITFDRFWYRFYCSGGFSCISRIYAVSIYGSPFADSIRYRWLAGQPGNTCIPFLMTNGRIFPGGDPTSVVSLSE